MEVLNHYILYLKLIITLNVNYTGIKIKKKKKRKENLSVLLPCDWVITFKMFKLISTDAFSSSFLIDSLASSYIPQKFPGVTYLYWALSVLCAFAYAFSIAGILFPFYLVNSYLPSEDPM